MAGSAALLDSNVIIAAVAEEHQHHELSSAILAEAGDRNYAVAAHSFAEAYATLTRQNPRMGFGRPPRDTWRVLQDVASYTSLVGLTPPQTFEAIGRYAEAGCVGARLYDHLIGMVAVQNAIPRIITWNVRHMRSLFPTLDVVDPAAALAA